MRTLVDPSFAPGSGIANVSFTVTNPALGKAILYINVSAQLDIDVWNNSSSPLTLQSGSNASTLTIYFPLGYFTATQLQAMQVSLQDWGFTRNADGSLLLTYTGANGASWAAGTSINISVASVLSTASPNAKNVTINIANITNTPGSIQASLSLVAQPSGKAKLGDVLQLSLDNQGVIYVSRQNGSQLDPLPNKLLLNLKNAGANPLYNGKTQWTGNPQVIVTFVYGSTSGSLAPDNIKNNPPMGSAWNIQVALPIAQAPWGFTNPDPTGQAQDPAWTLAPTSNNLPILGAAGGDQANVTFSFSPVISFTQVGHTQMTLLFTGFMQDENTPYDDEVFVLDINKQSPPPTRGLLSFSSLDPVMNVGSILPGITLSWGMFEVASVRLISSFPGSQPYTKNYPINAVPSTYPLGYDSVTLLVPAISYSQPITFTLQAFDGLGGFLNSLQFTIYLNLTAFVDPRDGSVYPIIQVGQQIWMAANLQFSSGIYYNNDPQNAVPYGRLYNIDQSKLPAPPEGWRVPTTADWNQLVNAFTPANAPPDAPYKALMPNGSSGFNAQLGGFEDTTNSGQPFQNLGQRGYYWTSSPLDSSDYYIVVFSSISCSISVSATTFTNDQALSIRYVKDL